MTSNFKIYLFSTCLLFLVPAITSANIGFPWSTTFNYQECTQRGGGGGVDCAKVNNDGISWSWGANPLGANYTQVSAAANYPGGTGGNGFRAWVGDGTNNQSAPVAVAFPAAQRELWIRWYMRYQKGFNWATQHYEKMLYIRTRAYPSMTGPVAIPGISNGSFYVFSNSENLTSSLTWNQWMNSTVSNGEWFPIEVYMKMDTNGSDGRVKIWIGDNLVLFRDNVNWSYGDAIARAGWHWFDFHSNQNSVGNASGPIGLPYAYVDYDDMAIYNTTPPNLDAKGNAFIGSINWNGGTMTPPETTTPTPKPPAPRALHIVVVQ